MVERYKDKRELFTNEQLIAVLEANGGLISHAADKLGIHRNSLSRWIKADPELEEATREMTEKLLDIAEANLITMLRQKQWDATKFYLSTKGRARGYGIKTEVTGPNGGAIPVSVERKLDLSKLSEDEIRTLIALEEKATATDQAGG
jgi:hypothetical protein